MGMTNDYALGQLAGAEMKIDELKGDKRILREALLATKNLHGLAKCEYIDKILEATK